MLTFFLVGARDDKDEARYHEKVFTEARSEKQQERVRDDKREGRLQGDKSDKGAKGHNSAWRGRGKHG